MSRTDTNIYDVQKWELENVKMLKKDGTPFYIRNIRITTEDGSVVQFTMFAEDDKNLFLST